MEALSSNGWSGLLPGLTLGPGEELRSKNGVYKLRMQGDGNLVAYDGSEAPYWSSYTQGRPGSVLTMGTDGNLVVHNLDGALGWDAHTQGHPGATLWVDDDGNMVVASPQGEPLWSVWQNTYDRGSGLGQWIGRTEGVIGGIASIVHDAVKILRVALPAIDSILLATGVGAPLAAAVAAVGAEIVAVDAAAGLIAEQIQQGQEGYAAVVGVLNNAVTPEQIAQVRGSLSTDEDRAGFDLGLQHAPEIAGSDVAVQSAATVLKTKVSASDIAKIPAIFTPRVTTTTTGMLGKIAGALPRTTTTTTATLGKLGGALASGPPAAASTSNILAILAKANGLPDAASYVAHVQAGAVSPPTYGQVTGAEPAPPRAPPRPAPPRAQPPPTSSGGAGLAIGLGLGLVALVALAR